jgi:diguanylate cyclase (GGDEF)-like protein
MFTLLRHAFRRGHDVMTTESIISLDQIARMRARSGLDLRFERQLERRFEHDTGAERCRKVVRQNYVGLATYNLFLVGDWLLVHDIFLLSLILHLAIMSPIMLGVNLVVSRRPPAWLREGVLAGGIVLGTMAILLLTLASRSPLRSSEHMSVVLVILFATMVQRIRFQFVVAACFVSLVLYVAALANLPAYDWQRMGVADAVCAGVVLFSLIGCYNLESELRAGYLLSLRDRLLNEELERISRRDALTDVGNRRALDQAIAGLEERAKSTPTPVAVLLVDIDHFKSFNDSNGHLAGDACLRRVAALIGRDDRIGPDRVFRFGGEEFLVLLDGADSRDGLAIGQRIRADVEAAAIRREPTGSAVVSVSIGVAVRLLTDTCTLAHLVAEADDALYAAKHNGRNQVRLSAPQTPVKAVLDRCAA